MILKMRREKMQNIYNIFSLMLKKKLICLFYKFLVTSDSTAKTTAKPKTTKTTGEKEDTKKPEEVEDNDDDEMMCD